MEELHVWTNGEDFAPGTSAENAKRWLMQQSGESAEDCEGDGWSMVPDDAPDMDENGKPTGKTARDAATEWYAAFPLADAA